MKNVGKKSIDNTSGHMYHKVVHKHYMIPIAKVYKIFKDRCV